MMEGKSDRLLIGCRSRARSHPSVNETLRVENLTHIIAVDVSVSSLGSVRGLPATKRLC